MRKTLYALVVVTLLLFAVYNALWIYAANKTKSMLKKISSYAKYYELEFTYGDIIAYGFPFKLELCVKNPKIVALKSTSIKLDSLLIKYKPFSKWLFLSIPSNVIDITVSDDNREDYSVVCNTRKLAFNLKLNELPFLLQIKKEFSIIDYVNLLRYEDYGLICTTLNDNNKVARSSEGNYLQLVFDKKSNEHVKFSVSSHIGKYTESNNYPEINTSFDVEILGNQSNLKLNLDVEEFLINGNNFAIDLKGRLHNLVFTELSYSFNDDEVNNDQVNIDMLNYKECIFFLASQYLSSCNYQAINNIQDLVLDVARRINDNDIRVTLSYNKTVLYIGNMKFDAFIDKMHELCNNEGKGKKDKR